MFNYLAETIVLIIKFDSIFQASSLLNFWPQYMNAIKLAEQNINLMNATSSPNNLKHTFSNSDISGLKNVLSKIDYLLSGHFAFQVNARFFLCHS